MNTRLLANLLIVFALAFWIFLPIEVQANDCAQQWAWPYTLEFRPGSWEVGYHEQEFLWSSPDGTEYRQLEFLVTDEAPLHQGQVFLRSWVITSIDGTITEINPAQDTAMQLTWTWSHDEMSRQEAENFRAATTLQVRWDSGEWIDVPAGPLTNSCAVDNPAHFQRSWGPNY